MILSISLIATPQPTVPEILNSEGAITFTEGEKSKLMECYADSVPPPEVTWEYDVEVKSKSLF